MHLYLPLILASLASAYAGNIPVERADIASLTSSAESDLASATSVAASLLQGATSTLDSIVGKATSAAGGALNTATSDIAGVVGGVTGAAGAAQSEAAHLFGAGVRTQGSGWMALLVGAQVGIAGIMFS
ncbi:hypothetical protein C8F01DRAFT_624785 [Mycena amicta]|nr:hypothetical protein C8F01DRAFT_624785 [Mycena amicta]